MPRAPRPRPGLDRSPRWWLDAAAFVDARRLDPPRGVLDAVDPREVPALWVERQGHAKEPRVVVRQHPERRTVEGGSHHGRPSPRAFREVERQSPRVLDGAARDRGHQPLTVEVPDVRRLERHGRQVPVPEPGDLLVPIIAAMRDGWSVPLRMRRPVRAPDALGVGIGARDVARRENQYRADERARSSHRARCSGDATAVPAPRASVCYSWCWARGFHDIFEAYVNQS